MDKSFFQNPLYCEKVSCHLLEVPEGYTLYEYNGEQYLILKKRLLLGDVCLAGLGLVRLPDLSGWKVTGDFDCSKNILTSLIGSPLYVGNNFDCSCNKLRSLKYGPEIVQGTIYDCSNNILVSLNGAPKKSEIWCSFNCMNNHLKSVQSAPEKNWIIKSDYNRIQRTR